MGTRGLTMVIKDNVPVVAQYGQWDHYPDGQGMTALNFVLDAELVKKLESKIPNLHFLEDGEVTVRAVLSGKFPEWPSLVYPDGPVEFDKLFPYLTRNHGAKILSLVANSSEEVIELQDHSNFVNDSLFCEQAYIIDLDNRTFEVYDGFVENEASCTGRFASDEPNDGGYYPITLVASWSLDDLPTAEEFLSTLSEDDEYEED